MNTDGRSVLEKVLYTRYDPDPLSLGTIDIRRDDSGVEPRVESEESQGGVVSFVGWSYRNG